MPFIGCVWKSPPLSLSLLPGYQTSSFGSVPLLGCGLMMKIGQCCSNLPTPHPSCTIAFPPPIIIFSRGLRPITRGWGGACSLSLSFHPQAFPLNQSVLIYPFWSQSVSISAVTPHKHAHSETDKHTTTNSLRLSLPLFSPQSFDYLVTQAFQSFY